VERLAPLDLVVVVAVLDHLAPVVEAQHHHARVGEFLAFPGPAGSPFDGEEPLPLKPDAGQEFAEGGAVAGLGGCRPRGVLGCEHEGGSSMDDDRGLHQEAAPRRAVHAKQPGGRSPDRDRLVGLRDRRARMRGSRGPGLSRRRIRSHRGHDRTSAVCTRSSATAQSPVSSHAVRCNARWRASTNCANPSASASTAPPASSMLH
jgi:hypothetical protein